MPESVRELRGFIFNLPKKDQDIMHLHSMLLSQVDGTSSNEDAQTFHSTWRDLSVYWGLQKYKKNTNIKYDMSYQFQ